MSVQAEMHLERNLFRRLERLVFVRRFIFSWALLLVLLTGITVAQGRGLTEYYQVDVPVSGGTYREGILGQFTNANPVYASGLADSSVSRLVFAGLLKYNDQNELVGDLAESWKPNKLGDEYTVQLKPGLTWHDDEPLTAEDVIFTFNVIKNPDARSPLRTVWQDVAVSAPDERTLVFELPNPLASFPEALTTGIIPQHVLGDVPMADMRSAIFNTTKPIGAGPFEWDAIEVSGEDAENRQERIGLTPFQNYNGGEPKLGSFTIRTFRTPEQMIASFEEQEINAMAGLHAVPEQLASNPAVRKNNMLLTAQVMTFFRNSQEILKDSEVRRALVRAVDTVSIMRSLQHPTIPVNEPLLIGQLGYDKKFKQPGYDPQAARELLSKQGWKPGKDGIRFKKGKPLTFRLHTQDTEEYTVVAERLKEQWRAVGVDVHLAVEDDASLQNTLTYHSYDALLYGIAIGPDPDVFVYWHSSQADERLPSRLNFSEYDSAKADAALADARTRLTPRLRAVKLEPFLQAWQSDAPALGLYQPRFLYITRGQVYGLTQSAINSDAERLINVQNWMIRTARETPQYN